MQTNRSGVGRAMLAGSLAGTAGTVVMSAVMLGAKGMGLTGKLPPKRLAEHAIENMGGRPATQDEAHLLAAVTHVGFGALAGALFGLLTAGFDPARRIGPAAGLGAVFASGVWLVSYQGWIPALEVMPRASRDRPGRVGTMVVAHWVFGAVLGLLTAVLRR